MGRDRGSLRTAPSPFPLSLSLVRDLFVDVFLVRLVQHHSGLDAPAVGKLCSE